MVALIVALVVAIILVRLGGQILARSGGSPNAGAVRCGGFSGSLKRVHGEPGEAGQAGHHQSCSA